MAENRHGKAVAQALPYLLLPCEFPVELTEN